MTSLNTNAQSAISDLISWKWHLSDLEKIQKNGYSVFSCFSCAGGSSFGYKLAGYDVLGNIEIDKTINEIYKQNHNPKYNLNMDIRDFKRMSELPPELYGIDILDGSPPCTSFSLAGNRERDWGKEKKFAEGQKLQTLDDLFFDFLDVAKKLNPKIIIAENVTGIIKGAARGYCNLIIKHFDGIGYDVQMFQLNAATMGVPQRRERVFFIGRKKDLRLPVLKLNFNEPPILFGDVRSAHGKELQDGVLKKLLELRQPRDKKISQISERIKNKYSGFNHRIVHDNEVCSTIVASCHTYRMFDGNAFSNEDYINVSTFPQDFICPSSKLNYVCGMSVPPLMTYHIAKQVRIQLLDTIPKVANRGAT